MTAVQIISYARQNRVLALRTVAARNADPEMKDVENSDAYAGTKLHLVDPTSTNPWQPEGRFAA